MENVKVIIQKVVAIITVFIIIMTQYVITGLIETTYAIDLLATQSANVQFRAYFKNGEEELTEIESNIDAKGLKLKIDVAVKNEGYFNGQISLENAGFKLTQATANDYINKVENNIIYLNQINAEETASLEVGIEYLDEEKIQVSTLCEPSTVKLKGTYTSSLGSTTIDSGSDVKVTWTIPEGTKAELDSKVLTNSIYNVNEENKKIVQFLISGMLSNNAYPIKNTEIKATIPEGATNIEVHKRTTKSTNGEQDFTASNYNTENNVLTISVNNDEVDGKISWMKNVKDIYVVTYEYPESTDLSAQNITINEVITTQDIDKATGNNVAINAEEVQLPLNKNEDGIASVSKLENETQIYKGKIYSGEGRDFTSYTIAYVDYVEGIKEIEITENEAKYAKEVEENGTNITEESNANVEIKTIKINKEKVASILGEDWKLIIGEQEINKDTEADENGDIIIQLAEGTKTITIKTSKPVNNGSFVVETTKSILKTDYTREQLKEFTILKDSSSIKYVKNDDEFNSTPAYSNITLKDTESKASFDVSVNSLSSEEKNENVKITTVLLNNNESKDLYKNPKIKITLPKQVKKVTITDQNLMFGNGLSINEVKVITENEKKVIYVDIEGTQNQYNSETLEGTTLIIYCTIEVDEEAETSDEEIVLNYTNDLASSYEDNGQQRVPVILYVPETTPQQQNNEQNQQSDGNNNNQQTGNENNQQTNDNAQQTEELKIYSELKAYVGGEEIKSGEEIKAGEIVQYELNIINRSNADINGLGLEINISEEASLIEYNPDYPKQNPEQDGAYYADGDLFIKKQDKNIIEQNINIKAGKTYTYTFKVEINTDLTENKNVQTNVGIKKDENNIANLNIQHNIKTAKIQTIVRPLYAKIDEEIKAEKSIMYEIEIRNLTDKDLSNVKVHIKKNDPLKINTITWYLQEDDISQSIEPEEEYFVIESIPANQKAGVVLNARGVQCTSEVDYAELSANIEDDEKNIYRSNLLKNIIKGYKIEATIEQEVEPKRENDFVKIGDKINYIIKLKNLGYLDAKNIGIIDEFSQYLNLISVKLNGKEFGYEKETIVSEDYDRLSISTDLNSKEELTIEIFGEVAEGLPDGEIFEIKNKVLVYCDGEQVTETKELINNIEKDENDLDNEDYEDEEDEELDDEGSNYSNDNEGDAENSGSKENNNKEQFSISGTAWLDENENGERDNEEELIKDINVLLINIDSKNTKTTKTQEDGKYIFTDIEKGEYIVAFEYDTGKYTVTKYNADGINSNRNSDVENVTMTIDGKNKKVASTNTLTISGNSLANIDIGLKKVKKFDLELSKTISKVTIKNSSGTKVYGYKNVELAKVEIKSKELNGSIVDIEYKIRITNKGEIEGYARNIVDYKSSDLEFDSEENSKWKKNGNNLYNTSLADIKIKPGETKELTLVLKKKMTNSNTGLTNNIAEIAEDFNQYGISDIDSTPNNKNANEDDIGQANVIVSVSTGKTISYIVFTLIITIGIGLFIYINFKRILYKKLSF